MADNQALTRIRVALLPESLDPDPAGVCAVVDVIRASTTLVTLAEAGDPDVWLASSPEAARRGRARLGRPVVLCGEQGGVKPEGFDHGNSPREIAAADFSGRVVVFATTNGTRALRRWRETRRTYVAALRNVGAVAWRLLEMAVEGPEPGSITLVCAGRNGEIALDDVYTAGAVVRRMLHAQPDLELDETAVIAMQVNRSYQSAAEALKLSRSARLLEPVGLADDVPFCAETDVSIAVPELGGDGKLRLLEDA